MRSALRHPLLAALLLSLALLPTFALSAQEPDPGISSIAFDMSFGLVGALEKRDGVDRMGATGAFTLSRTAIKAGPGWLVGAAHASGVARAAGFGAVEGREGLGNDRVTSSYAAIGALGGWTQRSDQTEGARLLVGPAYFVRAESSSGLGLIARFDGAKDTPEKISLTFFVEAQMPPAFLGEREVLAMFGVGLRLH